MFDGGLVVFIKRIGSEFQHFEIISDLVGLCVYGTLLEMIRLYEVRSAFMFNGLGVCDREIVGELGMVVGMGMCDRGWQSSRSVQDVGGAYPAHGHILIVLLFAAPRMSSFRDCSYRVIESLGLYVLLVLIVWEN